MAENSEIASSYRSIIGIKKFRGTLDRSEGAVVNPAILTDEITEII